MCFTVDYRHKQHRAHRELKAPSRKWQAVCLRGVHKRFLTSYSICDTPVNRMTGLERETASFIAVTISPTRLGQCLQWILE